jgi:hypothetical protein
MLRRRRFATALSSEGLAQAVRTLIVMAEMPMALKFWGASTYSEWLILIAWATVLSPVCSAFVGAGGRQMSEALVLERRERSLDVLKGLLMAAHWTSFLLIATAVVAIWARFDSGTVVGLAGYALVSLWWTLAAVPLTAQLKHATVTFWGSVTGVFEFAALAAVIVLGLGPQVALVSYAVARGIGVLVLYEVGRRGDHLSPASAGAARWSSLAGIARPASGSLLVAGANALNNSALRVLVANLFGPLVLIAFVGVRTATRVGFQAINSLKRVIEPELTAAYARREHAFATRVFVLSMSLTFALTLAVQAVLVVLWPFVEVHWLRGSVHVDRIAVMTFGAIALANGMWMLALSFLNSKNLQHVVGFSIFIIYGLMPIILVDLHADSLLDIGLILLAMESLVLVAVFLGLRRHVDPTLGAGQLPGPQIVSDVVRSCLSGWSKWSRSRRQK